MNVLLRYERPLTVLAAFLAWGLVVYAILYLQQVLGLPPCPLCIFQRIGFMAFGLIALVAATLFWHSRLYPWLMAFAAVSAAIGLVVAARHLWLQWFPTPGFASCGPGLSYMLENYSLPGVFRTVFDGSGNCTDLHWSFLGLSIPGWSLAAFAGFTGWSGWQSWRAFTRR